MKTFYNCSNLAGMLFVQSGFTPLHIASHYGSMDVAKLLLDNGADIDFSARVCIDCFNNTNITFRHICTLPA